MMTNLLKAFLLMAALYIIFSIQGCTPSTLTDIRDDRFTVGCEVINSGIKYGAMYSDGGIEVCKLVCSPIDELPPHFTYNYDSGACKIGLSTDVE